MQVLFSIVPGHGHFFPFLPLARALTSAGHDVSFATSASYGDIVRQNGFGSVAVGIDYTQGSISFDDGAAEPVEQVMFIDNPPQMLEDLTSHLEQSPPDVMLVDPTELGSMVAAEAADIPWGSVVNGKRNGFYPGYLPFEEADREGSQFVMFRRTVEQLRSIAALPPIEYLYGEAPYDRTFSLCMAPPSFNGWPLQVQHHTSHPLRPEIHASDSDEDWLSDLADDQELVAISFGTLFGTPELYEDAASSALESGALVVVATNYELDIEHDRLIKVEWVSMDKLMALANVLVHHGGWGSTIAALASGTPSVVVPMGADQFWNAQGINNVGAGITAARGQVATSIGSSVRKVLDDPIFTLNATRLRDEIDAMPSAHEVVPLIERLASERVILNKSDA